MNGSLLDHLQMGMIAAAVFFCIWGLLNFGPCLVRVLQGKTTDPARGHLHCPYHASTALVCIGALFFALSRFAIIEQKLGAWGAGWLWMAAMLTFFMKISVSSWQLTREKQRMAKPSPRTLGAIFAMQLIVIASFVVVGLLGAMEG